MGDLPRQETFNTHKGFRVPDPFAPRQRPGASILNAILATAIFRCWHILLFYSGWATLISVLNHQGHKLSIQPTLLTVIGTVLGFVISYRTTSSFERYNEGRRLWSQIMLASRTFARTVWFHILDPPATDTASAEELKSRALIEKKTVINLLEAFAVAVKHYLRGEDGIYYKDLYYLVKFLPAYELPPGMPSMDLSPEEVNSLSQTQPPLPNGHSASLEAGNPSLDGQGSSMHHRNAQTSSGIPPLMTPSASQSMQKKAAFLEPFPSSPRSQHFHQLHTSHGGPEGSLHRFSLNIGLGLGREKEQRVLLSQEDEVFLYPASMPPKYSIFDLFPFSLLVNFLTEKGKELGGKKAAKARAKVPSRTISHNVPLEISLYLSSYIAALQNRKSCDVSTVNALLAALLQLVDSLTGLERILTTPIPFSYSIHLWLVTTIYCLALPFQIWQSLQWLTIPATIIASFIFFGFLVAGEEIENPFGYDKNDLNLDHFTHNIIRNELRAIVSAAPPDPAKWAFVAQNDLLFSTHMADRITPDEWMEMGHARIQQSLSVISS